MALGAAPGAIHRLILGQLGGMALIGGSIGAAGALEVGRFADSLLFRLNGHDPAVLSIAVVLLSLVALAAGYIPAHRASKVNPITALRYE
jgi:ABC-type antimicrobial peptide transport system permease subunit